MSEEANKVESLLFSSGRKMREDEIVMLTQLKLSEVKKGLEELKEKYSGENNSLMVFNEGDSWKLTVREKYLDVVQKIVSETELDKSIMETLAVIAWKYPILQADVIKIRNNKAYDHMRELEEAGFITRERHGRTRSIRLTQKFFDYFDLPKDRQSRETFKQAVPEEIRNAIDKREGEIKETEDQIEEAKARKEEIEQKYKEDKENPEVDIVDEMGKETKLEVYEETPEEAKEEHERHKEVKEKLLGVEIITEEKETQKREVEREKKADEIVEKIETEKTTPEVEKRIDELIHPAKAKTAEESFQEEAAALNEEPQEETPQKESVEEEEKELAPEEPEKPEETPQEEPKEETPVPEEPQQEQTEEQKKE